MYVAIAIEFFIAQLWNQEAKICVYVSYICV